MSDHADYEDAQLRDIHADLDRQQADDRYERERQNEVDLTADKQKLQSAVMYASAYLQACDMAGPQTHGRAISMLNEVLRQTGVRA